MEDPNEIVRDVESLSIGASNVFDRFLHITGDYIKQANQAKSENDPNQGGFGFEGNRRTKLTPQVSCTQM
jgi:hypothetical protein